MFFYNHEKIEEKLNLEGYIYYPIDKRIEDAKKICSTKNVTVVDFKVNKDYFFPTDYLKLKEDLFHQLKVNEIDLQIFGEDDEENYKDYIYANDYITCPHTKLSENVNLHASIIKPDLNKYAKYLPSVVLESIKKLNKTKIVCISGKSGSGKNIISEMIKRDFGDTVHIDIDILAHKALKNNFVKRKIDTVLNDNSIYDELGNIDRKKMGKIVFNDKILQDKVYAITWEYMNKEIIRTIRENHKIVILNWYNIINKNYWNENNIRIITEKDYNERKQYVIKRDNISPEYFELREKNALNYDDVKCDIKIFDISEYNKELLQEMLNKNA